jgi:hypothetical protein
MVEINLIRYDIGEPTRLAKLRPQYQAGLRKKPTHPLKTKKKCYFMAVDLETGT